MLDAVPPRHLAFLKEVCAFFGRPELDVEQTMMRARERLYFINGLYPKITTDGGCMTLSELANAVPSLYPSKEGRSLTKAKAMKKQALVLTATYIMTSPELYDDNELIFESDWEDWGGKL